MKTHIIQFTAVRSYVGQTTIELPSYCPPGRFEAIVSSGGAVARQLASQIQFGRIIGTGLANPYARKLDDAKQAEIDLASIRDAMARDGFKF